MNVKLAVLKYIKQCNSRWESKTSYIIAQNSTSDKKVKVGQLRVQEVKNYQYSSIKVVKNTK